MSELAPSERELDILKVLWEIGEGSVRDIHLRLHPRGESHFNTVQTLLRIMEEKGLVSHRSLGRTFIYRPRHTREKVTKRFLHKIFDGALDQMVLSLLQAEDISPAELKELERLIARARRAKQSREEGGE